MSMRASIWLRAWPAPNLTDIVELQSAFWRKQFGVLTAQAEEVHASAKVTADAAERIRSQMARGAAE
jgi:hypothetical protein